jgi:hypothetical protein
MVVCKFCPTLVSVTMMPPVDVDPDALDKAKLVGETPGGFETDAVTV